MRRPFQSIITVFLVCVRVLGWAQSSQTVNNGQQTQTAAFPPGCVFNWTNDKPGIGLPASGTDDIAPFTAINNGTTPVVATIKATPVPLGYAYISNQSSNDVSVVSVVTHMVVKTIPLTGQISPFGVAATPDGTKVYVTNVGSGTVSVISTANNTVIKTVIVGAGPFGIAVSPDGSKVYVMNGNSGTISVINTATDVVDVTIPGLSTPQGACVSPDGKWLYVTDSRDPASLYIVNTGTNNIDFTVPLTGTGNDGIAISPDGATLYIANNNSGTVTVFNTITRAETKVMPGFGAPYGVAISRDGTMVYVANSSFKKVSVIDAATNIVIKNINTSGVPFGVSISTDGKELYVANHFSNMVDIFSTADNTLIKSVLAGTDPLALGMFTTSIGCNGPPITFSITVNPAAPTITAGPVTGSISACVGTASASPYIQQFTVSGSDLTAGIKATAPADFQVSLSANSGYGSSVLLNQSGGKVTNVVVYVRSAATATTSVTDNVVLTSAGAASQNVAVSRVINKLLTVDPVTDKVYSNGDVTAPISFSGTANTFTWTNDKPGIGLAASGTGDITSFTAINTGTTPVIATIKVTPLPTDYAYIANQGSNMIAVVNCTTHKVIKSISGGSIPVGIVTSADGKRVYIANNDASTVSVINTADNTLLTSIPVGNSPYGIAISPDGTRVYTANSNAASISVIETQNNSVLATIPNLPSVISVAVSPDGKWVYAATEGSPNAVYIINASTNVLDSTIPLGSSYNYSMVMAPDGKSLYFTNNQNSSVTRVNLATKTVSAIPVGGGPYGIAINSMGTRLYVACSQAGEVDIINTSNNAVIKTLPTSGSPFTVSVSSDDKELYVTNRSPNAVDVFNTTNYSKITTITGPAFNNPMSLGNFISKGPGCPGQPIIFKITVNSKTAQITATAATGTISACAGLPSVSPNVQQFTVSGTDLTAGVTATAPAGFEVSLLPNSGYGNSLIINQAGGLVTNVKVYVRSAASATGNIADDVVLTSTGAADQRVAVTGTINALPTVNKPADATYTNGEVTTVINFAGTGTTFTWTNDKPGIGLPANGTGDISPFTAVNTGTTAITATIKVTPANATGCPGIPQTFTIKVNASPAITATLVSGSISACVGTASVSPNIQQFTVSGASLTGDISVAAPTGFEISLSAVTGYGSNLVLSQTNGALPGTIIYVRSAASAGTGAISGNVALFSAGATNQSVAVTGTINAPPTVNKPGDVSYTNGNATIPINFTGTGTTFTWTNDKPGIGLPANGFGDIPSFTAANTGTTAIVATIKVTPANATGCPGIAQTFTITVNSQPPSITAGPVTGAISACAGSPSASPNIQQFTVSGIGLITEIIATAPNGFEVSLSANSGFANAVTLTQSGGKVTNVPVYVRSAASSLVGPISGKITLATAGATNLAVRVSGVVSALPVVDPVGDKIYVNGDITTAINFTGTGNIFHWVNDTPAIGLPASGTGDLPSFTTVNVSGSQLKATITVTPEIKKYGYTTNANDNTVSVIDISTNKSVATIPVGSNPVRVTISPDGSRVYITNESSDDVSVINISMNSVINTIPVGGVPSGTTISPDGGQLYVANIYDNNISVINTVSGSVVKTIQAGLTPMDVVLSNDGKLLYVSNNGENDLWVINTANGALIANIPVGKQPEGITMSRDGNWVYVTNFQDATISVINTATNKVTAILPISSNPSAITVTPDGKLLYSTSDLDDKILVIDIASKQIVKTITAGTKPWGMSLNRDGSLLYVTTPGNNTVLVINTATNAVVTKIPVGAAPSAFGTIAVPGADCPGIPATFTITVNVQAPSITHSAVTGTIIACAGSPSASPNIQQFAVSGTALTGDITATASIGFEVSLSANSGFAKSVSIAQANGSVNSTVLYVRSANYAIGSISGDIGLSTPGVISQTVQVRALVNVPPIVNAVSDQTKMAGEATAAVNFTGTGNTYSWNNDKPEIGLPANGTGDIASFIALNPGANQIIANITVTPAIQQMAYVPNSGDGTLSVISVATNTVVTTIPVGETPVGAAISPDGKKIYVCNHYSSTVSVIDAATNKVIATIDDVYSPYYIVISPDGSKIFAVNNGPGTITVIDGSTNIKTGLIQVDSYPLGIAISQDGKKLYVVSTNLNNVSVIDVATGLVIAKIDVGEYPEGIVLSQDGSKAYVTNYTLSTVSIINTLNNTVIKTIGTGGNPTAIAISPDGTKVYVSNSTSNNVTVIDALTNSVLATYATGNTPQGVSLNADGSVLYVTNFGSNNVSVINALTGSLITTIPVGGSPTSFGNFISNGGGCPGSPVKFKITVNAAPVPVITATGTLSSVTTVYGTASSPTSFTIAGANMTTGILVTPPAGVEVSTDNINFSNTITVGAAGTIAPTTIYVRLAKTTPVGSYGGSISLESIGVNTIYPQLPVSLVSPASLTVIANAKSKNYGTLLAGAPGSPDFTVAGLQNSETVQTVAIAYGQGAAATDPAGTYARSVTPANVTGGTFDPKNYAITYVNADLTVNKVPLTITADDKIKTYKDPNPILTLTYSGFVNNESPAQLTSLPVVSTIADQTSLPGKYTILVSGASSPNYDIALVDGVLTVLGTNVALKIPNTFTPNDDGINDTWNIANIDSYPGCTVNIYTRWGQNVFSSVGYGKSWDGRYKGTLLPVSTYYYIIDLKNDSRPYSGSVTIIR